MSGNVDQSASPTEKTISRASRGGTKAQDLVGRRFFRLTVVRRIHDGKKNTRWLCRCDCGKETVGITGNLKNGRHKSCGCYRGGPTSKHAKRRTITNGYAFVRRPDHPRANKYTGRVREHTIVMEQKIGRYLLPDERVHHLNGVRDDNRPENLELWVALTQPYGIRVADAVAWAKEILQRYGKDA